MKIMIFLVKTMRCDGHLMAFEVLSISSKQNLNERQINRVFSKTNIKCQIFKYRFYSLLLR